MRGSALGMSVHLERCLNYYYRVAAPFHSLRPRMERGSEIQVLLCVSDKHCEQQFFTPKPPMTLTLPAYSLTTIDVP